VVAAGGKDWAEAHSLPRGEREPGRHRLAADVRAELTAIAEFITARRW
jgi:hypothetical protein